MNPNVDELELEEFPDDPGMDLTTEELAIEAEQPAEPSPEPEPVPEAPSLAQVDDAAFFAEMMRRGMVPQPRQEEKAPEPDAQEALAELMYSDPAAYTREMQKLAFQQAQASIAPILRDNLQSTLTQGLQDEGRKIVANTLSSLTPAQLATLDNGSKDAIRLMAEGADARAARSKAAPITPQPTTGIPSLRNLPKEDQQAIAFFQRIAGDNALTESELAATLKEYN